MLKNKKAQTLEEIMKFILWAIVFVFLLFGIYFLLKFLGVLK